MSITARFPNPEEFLSWEIELITSPGKESRQTDPDIADGFARELAIVVPSDTA
jgi:hypothetical protein